MRITLSELRITTIALIAFIIVFAAYVQNADAATKDSGECGPSAKWTFDDSGKLTISGSGYMDDYDVIDAPWFKYAFDITKIEIKSGIRSIGDSAFYGLSDAKTVVLPDSLEMIGENAFEYCESIEKIDVPGSVGSIENLAFVDCTNLRTLILRKGIVSIGNNIVASCPSLETVHYTGTDDDWINDVNSYTDFGSKLEYDHSGRWDSGKVTKKPTCSSKGVKTFTCTICGDKKTEAVAKDPKAHKYGKWTRLNAKQHRKVCKLNKSHVVKAAHKWSKTKRIDPTLTKKGAQKYKCHTCGAVKSVAIPKLKARILIARASYARADSATIKWNDMRGAGRYKVYFGKCGTGNINLVKTLKAGKTSYDVKGLDQSSAYRFRIIAEKKINGKWEKISNISTGHFVTSSNKLYTNPKSLKVNRTSVTIRKGKTKTVKASVQKKYPLKRFLNDSHGPLLRYISSDKGVANVDSKGRITAKGKGTCKVYVIAVNGFTKAVKVTVK